MLAPEMRMEVMMQSNGFEILRMEGESSGEFGLKHPFWR